MKTQWIDLVVSHGDINTSQTGEGYNKFDGHLSMDAVAILQFGDYH